MRFLGILRFGAIGVLCIRYVVRAKHVADKRPACGDRFLRHIDAIGPHIGDQPDGFTADIDSLV